MSNPEHHCARPGLLGICYGLVSPSKQWRLDSCSPGLLLTLQGRRGRDSPSQLGESLLSVDPAGGEEDLPVRAWRGVGTLRCRGPAAGQQSVLSSREVGGDCVHSRLGVHLYVCACTRTRLSVWIQDFVFTDAHAHACAETQVYTGSHVMCWAGPCEGGNRGGFFWQE